MFQKLFIITLKCAFKALFNINHQDPVAQRLKEFNLFSRIYTPEMKEYWYVIRVHQITFTFCPMILFESLAFARSLMQPLYDKENDACLTFAQNFEALILSLKVNISNFSI